MEKIEIKKECPKCRGISKLEVSKREYRSWKLMGSPDRRPDISEKVVHVTALCDNCFSELVMLSKQLF